MSEEPVKKKAKKKKQVSWDLDPPGASSHTPSKKGKLNITSEIKQIDEPEVNMMIDTDVENLPAVLDNLQENIEKQLEEKAVKNNLTVTNVKTILKAVITNKDVVDLVHTSINGESFDNYRPKFTRSKTKELLETYDLEQVENKKSDYAYILEQELSEDSDDEEYTPNEEENDESFIADLIAESPVPDSPYFSSVCGDDETEGENGENIGQRTRSKLSLSETPLEAIEQQFVPPDITNDMYDTECDNQDWLDFLKDINNPLDGASDNIEDENDPEYNVMVEESIEHIDFEELRHDRAVKVSKTELHALMNEWFGCEDFSSEDEADTTVRKSPKNSPQKTKEKSLPCSEKKAPPSQLEHQEILKNLEIFKRENFFSDNQYCLLSQQIQQHVQLLLQTYLLTYKHPYVESKVALAAHGMLLAASSLASTEHSTFDVINLKPTMELVTEWENYLSNSNNSLQMTQFMSKEFQNGDASCRHKRVIGPARIAPQLMQFCAESTAFIFPLLLPDTGVVYRSINSSRKDYSLHEDHLLAIGLEEFTNDYRQRENKEPSVAEVCRNISTYLMPHKPYKSLVPHIKWCRTKPDNPVTFYYTHNFAPPVKHYVIVVDKLVKLKEHPLQLIPPNWKKCLFEKRSSNSMLIRVRKPNSYGSVRLPVR